MESSAGFGGLMAVFAVSGSVALLTLQVHKRLLSDFMKKVELEFSGIGRCREKKRVRFADDVVEPSSNNKKYRENHSREMLEKAKRNLGGADNNSSATVEKKNMPLNRLVLYKGVIQYKALRGCSTYKF